MKAFLQKISKRWEIFNGRFEFLIVKTKEEYNACHEILEVVRKQELNRVAGKSVLDSHSFAGGKTDYYITAIRDTENQKIVGCMKVSDAFQLKDNPSSNNEYHLSLFPNKLLKTLKIFTRLVVLKSYRKTAAGFCLMGESFRYVLSQGGQATLMSCEPNLFPMYKQLGLRPIGSAHTSPSGGYRIPMIFIPDREYLKKIKSPSLIWTKDLEGLDFRKIKKWYKKFDNCSYNFYDVDVLENSTEDTPFHIAITEGLSKIGKSELLKNGMLIQCKKDDLIVLEEDGGKSFGIVKRGMVKVIIGKKTISLLEAGDLFGEIAFVLGSNRTATLKAANNETEILLCSLSAVKRLSNANDKAIIWQNLAKVLAHRLVNRTNH